MSKIGRPIKRITGKRSQITTLVRSDLKRAIAADAIKHGRTLSQEVEHWLEALIIYRQMDPKRCNHE